MKSRQAATKDPLSLDAFAQTFFGHAADLAILQLDVELTVPGREIRIAGLEKISEYASRKYMTVGFPVLEDGQQHIMIESSCSVKSVFHDFIFNTDCSTFPGNSGSPIFLKPEEGSTGPLVVMGMNIGGKGENLFEPIPYSDDRASYEIFWQVGTYWGEAFQLKSK